jgi:glycosyltransferase involved in cell wall biosynthesis
MSGRMRVLSVLSSSNQLYSGIGRALFELSSRLADRIDYSFAIDDLNSDSVCRLKAFADRHAFEVLVGKGAYRIEGPDHGNADLGTILASRKWDIVETLGWANAFTNDTVLASLGATVLVHTPHNQPAWTNPMEPDRAVYTAAVHKAVIDRADLVLCDTPWERSQIRRLAPGRNNTAFLPLGFDTKRFRLGAKLRLKQLVFVGDLAEPRKRFDRVIELLTSLDADHADLRLVVVGNKSTDLKCHVPAPLTDRIELRGYVTDEELAALYAESAATILLSDFEAFGIPILESLACGTPVFLSDLEATASVFSDLRGARFCPRHDLDATARIVREQLSRGEEAIGEALADRLKIESRFDWDRIAQDKWSRMSAAWTRRNSWAWSA